MVFVGLNMFFRYANKYFLETVLSQGHAVTFQTSHTTHTNRHTQTNTSVVSIKKVLL